MAVILGKKCLLECDLIIVAGTSFSCKFKWMREPEGGGDPTPADLEGATALCQIREVNDGEIILDASEYVACSLGEVEIDLTPAATADLPEGKWPWDIIVTDRFGESTRLAAGKATIVDPISEDE